MAAHRRAPRCKVAREMALEMHAELCVLHVYEPLRAGDGPGFATRPYDADLKRESSELIARETAGWDETNVSLRPLVRAGAPALGDSRRPLIEEHPDLTIIATRGNSGWKRLISGQRRRTRRAPGELSRADEYTKRASKPTP